VYKYIGLLKTAFEPRDEAGLSDGFAVHGSATLESLAQVYGLRPPANEPCMTVGDYLSRRCCGQPRIGDRIEWERVELVIQEIHEGSISKVRLTVRALRERRRWLERRAHQSQGYGPARSPRDRRMAGRLTP